MVDKTQFLAQLGLSGFTPEEEEAIYQDFTYELGAAMYDGLSEEQADEFNRIITGYSELIAQWLARYEPNYRDDPEFKDFEVGYDADPERVPADKMFATVKWIQLNRPDFNQVYDRVMREYKASLDAPKTA